MKVQKLSDYIHQRVLGYKPTPWTKRAEAIAVENWTKFGLENATDPHELINIPLPDGVGDIHDVMADVFKVHGGYLDKLDKFQQYYEENGIPEPPDIEPLPVSGWQCYEVDQGKWVRSCQPVNPCVVGDFETVEVNPNDWRPVCFGVLADSKYYLWQADIYDLQTVADLGIKDMVIIGANCQFDRSFIKTEYLIDDDANLDYYDTQSAWIVSRGFSSKQRGLYKKKQEDEYIYAPWTDETATNGLDEVYKFYTGKTLDKSVRDGIVNGGYPWVRDNLGKVSLYCVKDLTATAEVFLNLYPEHRHHRHPINLLSCKLLGKAWLPLSSKRFPVYYEKAEKAYNETLEVVRQQLRLRITEVLNCYCPYRGITDEELPVEPQKTKTATNRVRREWLKANVLATPTVNDPWLKQLDWSIISTGDRRGYPKWTNSFKSEISLGSRATFLLLSVTWRGYPVVWEDARGWTYNDQPIPHPDGKDPITKEDRRVTDLFAKGFESAAESGILGSTGDLKDTLARLMSTVNWDSLRKRVAAIKTESPQGYPVVIPRLLVSGTATGRAADNTWMVASNPKAKRIGTELKSMIEPPPGWSIVGADIDGQEIGLAGSLGDAVHGYQGITALGLMCLIGDKKQKTDPHNVVASQVGVTRDISKNCLVFAALYGQGLGGTFAGLLKALPLEDESLIMQKTKKFLSVFKGTKSQSTGKFVNGLASEAFNVMENIADSPQPETAILKAKMTKALAGVKDYKTTRMNFPIQASGTDYKDLLVLFADYFYRKLAIDGRLMITIH